MCGDSRAEGETPSVVADFDLTPRLLRRKSHEWRGYKLIYCCSFLVRIAWDGDNNTESLSRDQYFDIKSEENRGFKLNWNYYSFDPKSLYLIGKYSTCHRAGSGLFNSNLFTRGSSFLSVFLQSVVIKDIFIMRTRTLWDSELPTDCRHKSRGGNFKFILIYISQHLFLYVPIPRHREDHLEL